MNIFLKKNNYISLINAYKILIGIEIEEENDTSFNLDDSNIEPNNERAEYQLEKSSDNKHKKMIYVSSMQYYAYQLFDRPSNNLHYFGRLFHQYIVDQYAKIVMGRLSFIRNNQETIRADLYQSIKNTTLTNLGYSIGKRIVLPSSFKGSPRYLMRLFQDSMAVIRNFGKPDLFVTVTCNPQWPEIQNELTNVKNSEKLTLIARVFKIKLKAIMHDILKDHIFGIVKAYMYVIEFQKRGLPHAHILLILENESKPRNSDDYDSLVSAQIPDPKKHPKAFATVTKSMIHGPCGIFNKKAPCMDDITGE